MPQQQMPQQQMPQQQMPQQQPPGYQHSSPLQKTMVAQPSPFAAGQVPGQGQAAQPAGGSGGFVQANPMQKTIVAGMSAPVIPVGIQPGGQPMPPGMQPGGQPMPAGLPPSATAAASGGNKTIALLSSEGVVSIARTGQAVQPAGAAGATQQGASALFWIMSLVIGIAIGALAYVVVLQL